MTADTTDSGAPMRWQILSQPSVLEALSGRRHEIEQIARRFMREARWIRAVGHGDSYFAPSAATEAFGRFSPIPFQALLAQEVAAYPPAQPETPGLLIAISMSGGVARTLEAAAASRARGVRVLGITNTPASQLADLADETIVLGIAEPGPFLSGTVTYTASVTVLLLIALSASATAEDFTELRRTVEAVGAAADREGQSREWAHAHRDAGIWYYLGMGSHIATAHYGCAKLAEVADAVGIAHETEEFFHEHHWVIREGHPVVVLTQDPPARQRAEKAIAQLRALNIPACVVGPSPSIEGAWHIPVPEVASWCAPIVGAVPMQWMAYWLAHVRGLDPDRRTHLTRDPRYAVSRRYR